MADLKDLQEMAKNGEISKKLLEDENFKAELKSILKEKSGIEITDEDISKTIKHLETALQSENILNEAKLETISGGVSNAKIIKSISTVVGAALGAGLGYKAGEKSAAMLDENNEELTTSLNKLDAIRNEIDKIKDPKERRKKRAERQGEILSLDKHINDSEVMEKYFSRGGAVVGGASGAGASYWLSNYICNKFDIK